MVYASNISIKNQMDKIFIPYKKRWHTKRAHEKAEHSLSLILFNPVKPTHYFCSFCSIFIHKKLILTITHNLFKVRMEYLIE